MPFGVVSVVGRGISVLDVGGGRRRERNSFGGKCGASDCKQWGFVAWLFSAVRGGDAALTKLLWAFLVVYCFAYHTS